MFSALTFGWLFLKRTQHPDGYWLPLWFGNQHMPDDINPTCAAVRHSANTRAT